MSSTARLLERYLNVEYDRTLAYLRRAIVVMAALLFIMLTTLVIAFDSIFPGRASIDTLDVGDIAPQDIYAPVTTSFTSDVLTERNRQSAAANAPVIFDSPDTSIIRQRTRVAEQILSYLDNVRADTLATRDQRIQDIEAIRELDLEPAIIDHIIDVDSDAWREISAQVVTVLDRVMSEEVRESNLADIRERLGIQVVQFDEQDAAVIEAIVSDLIQPNTIRNDDATLAARQEAMEAVLPVQRGFVRGELVVSGGTQVGEDDYEALQELGLIRLTDRRNQEIARALLASVLAMVIVGLYIVRFRPSLIYDEQRMLALLATIFIIVLTGARLGLSGQIYIYPTAALALLFVVIIGREIAVIGAVALAALVGLMANSSLEIAVLVGAGGLIAALSLKRAESLNNFFVAGMMVAIINIGVAALFNLGTPTANNAGELALLVVYSLINGTLAAAAAVAGMYIVGLLFNLPTATRIVELSQPNQPLLQRLMREAPGTYQHSLQVANLSEQVANAIGANSELTRVAALYHDIGKMLNPAFFTENQSGAGNPHDILNDPYRSADIIISHVTEGDDMARQYRLPVRLRDFIREHHGTSQVYVFYRQAVILAGDDPTAVDVTEFTYPGPKPQSRETAVLMLADSCESAARSRQPKNKQEIEEIVVGIIDQKRTSGQLDDSGLTLNDLKSIQTIFIEMLQAIYHTRLNYDEAVSRVRKPDKPADRGDSTRPATEDRKKPDTLPRRTGESPSIKRTGTGTGTNEIPVISSDEDDDNTPLPEVPRLRRRGKGGDRADDSETRTAASGENNNGHMEIPAVKGDDAEADEADEDAATASDSAESESETTRGQQSDT